MSRSTPNLSSEAMDHSDEQHDRRFSIINYGCRLEGVLKAQFNVSAMMHHRGEAGSAREFFIESILKRFLPANVVIGRGEIIDSKGSYSRQQDLLLYRSNFPVIDSLAGSHIYLAEGVLATIEVKTHLTKNDIKLATQNIASIRSLSISDKGVGEDNHVEGGAIRPQDMTLEGAASRVNEGKSPISKPDPWLVAAPERIWSYVFSFGGEIDTVLRHAETNQWFDGNGPDFLCILGRAFGAISGSPTEFENPTDKEFNIQETDKPLGQWLAHMLWVLGRRYRRPVLGEYLT
jgi:hypothetical protein